MSIGSFSASLSGLNANQQDLAVIGNNLANINTVAYKASTVSFADLVSQNVGGSGFDPTQVGLGVGVDQISPNFTQGSIQSTGIATNVAIQGNGLFIVGNSDDPSYTRAGNFSLNSSGELITPDGLPVQGYTQVDPTTGGIITTGGLSNLVVPPGLLRAPTPTTSFSTVDESRRGRHGRRHVQLAGPDLRRARQPAHGERRLHEHRRREPGTTPSRCPARTSPGGTAGTPTSLKTGTVKFNGSGLLTAVDGGAPGTVSRHEPDLGRTARRRRTSRGMSSTPTAIRR